MKLKVIFSLAIIQAIFLVLTGCQNPVNSRNISNPGLIISFEQFSEGAPEIAGPTIHLNGINGPVKAAVAVDNPQQYSSIEWFVNGITGKGASFTLDSSNAAYNSVGEHHLTAETVRNNVPYNKTVIFIVAE